VTEDDSNDEKSGTEVGSFVKGSQRRKATTRGRDLVGAITGSADQGVVWRSIVEKFTRGGSGFDPNFSDRKGQGCVYRSDQRAQQNEEDGGESGC